MDKKDILAECKIGLGMSTDDSDIDNLITQKINAVKGFMLGAGASEETLETDLAIGIIVMGVTDLWELKSGEIKFSPAFYTLLTQIA